MMDVGNTLTKLGEFGPYQLFIYIFTGIPAMMAGCIALQNVFIMGVPKHRCWISECEKVDSIFNQFMNFAHDPDVFNNTCQRLIPTSGVMRKSMCNMTSSDILNMTTRSETCKDYVYDLGEFVSTTATEWDLVCDKSTQLTIASSIFMMGNLFGSLIFGICSDKFGRKSVYYWGPILGSSAAILASYSNNFYLFTFAIFFVAMCATGMYMIGFVLGIEFIGTKYRLWCANGYQMLFALGEIIFAAIAFNVRNWRQLELIVGYLLGSMFTLAFILPESVRWQSTNHQPRGALDTLKKIARWNRKQNVLDDDQVILSKTREPLPHHTDDNTSDDGADAHSDILNNTEPGITALIKHPILRRWSLNLFFNWGTNALVYYGLSLSASKIGDGLDVYSTFILLAAVEIPFGVGISIIMNIWGRRYPLAGTMILGGVICLLPSVMPERFGHVNVILGVLGKGCITASFALVYFYTAEIYPTVMRSVGVGTCSTFARVGAMIAPFVAEFKAFGESGPLIICGIVSLIAGVLALDLPETHRRELPETVEDVYKLKKGSRFGEATKLTSQ